MTWYLIIIRNNEERDNDDKCNSNEWGKNSILLIYCGYKGREKKEEFFVSAVEGKEMFSQNIFEMEMLNKL